MNHKIARLQFITHSTAQSTPAEQARQVLEGGCQWIQLRMKKHCDEEILAEAEKIKALKVSFNFTFIINDNPKLALQCGADGVHLGKQDCSPIEARQLLGDKFIIGGTANTIDDVIRLTEQGVDYIGLGPFRFTATKENLSPVLGLDGYQRILEEMKAQNINLPVVGIGGVEQSDVDSLRKTGLHGLAISSAIWQKASIVSTTKEWLQAIEQTIISTERIS
ncbi:thiamine phosphate synthase [Mangrovibacterium marinum]|uniref:Thiamine-phosphate synthase n=1 Tax=Mangrovibacterium marinum TaxID=1639118 RepID=A0A2T5BX27_9BACT|nr:thiamine phosphate synthase [Mangrovibacterium marinum]PTN04341.1 thiamine-phosphate diphosphorylase [Mangrovibacterium marinum]